MPKKLPVIQEVVNTWDQLVNSGGGIAIVPARMPGRQSHQNGWAVFRVNEKGQQLVTDKKAAWFNHGKMTFSEFTTSRAAALLEAQAWIKERYGIDGPWVRNRQRDYVLATVNQQYPLRKD